jgi:hypothetical protein
MVSQPICVFTFRTSNRNPDLHPSNVETSLIFFYLPSLISDSQQNGGRYQRWGDLQYAWVYTVSTLRSCFVTSSEKGDFFAFCAGIVVETHHPCRLVSLTCHFLQLSTCYVSNYVLESAYGVIVILEGIYRGLRATAHQLRQDKHQDMRQKCSLASFVIQNRVRTPK